MQLLFIAPLPPPITGHSIVSKVLLDDLVDKNDIAIVNLSKDSFKEGIDGIKRIFQVVRIIKDVWIKKRKGNVIYLTISESFAGNVKDLFIYLVCFRSLSLMYIHLHGGTIKRELWDRYPALALINKFFLKRIAGAIITGKSHLPIFERILPPQKIHIVPNFAQDYLFVSEDIIELKFLQMQPLRILYMSNLIPKKGYVELADAFLSMEDELKSRVQIDFAGGFESDEKKQSFVDKFKDFKQVTYHGIVDNAEKQNLFSKAHIFCLPTSYLEGQPISILEAYASGCVVLTTAQSGIQDIFQDTINGFEILPSAESIKKTVLKILVKNQGLNKIALANRQTAYKKYRTSIYNTSLTSILKSKAGDDQTKH